MVRLQPVALAVVLVGLNVVGCGGAGRRGDSASQPYSGSATSGAVKVRVPFSVAHTVAGLEGDAEDDDAESKSEGAYPSDGDSDTDNDFRDNAEKGYYDRDDRAIRAYGRAPSAADRRALTGVVRRYVEVAGAADGSVACSLMDPVIVRTSPQDYGHAGGPAYLRGATTCEAVMSRLFHRYHAELSEPIAVTGVRVDGDRAYVLLGSARRPASFMSLRREGGVWKLDELTGTTLP